MSFWCLGIGSTREIESKEDELRSAPEMLERHSQQFPGHLAHRVACVSGHVLLFEDDPQKISCPHACAHAPV